MNTETLKGIKKEFFAFRNGIIADTLRKAGMPYMVIFGLQIPQLSNISRSLLENITSKDDRALLGDELWDDADVRESRLLAAYVYDPEDTSMEKALFLASSVKTREEADILAFRIFKRLPCKYELLKEMQKNPGKYLLAIPALETHLN